MSAIENLHNRIDLNNIPFTDRGSRLLLFLRENTLSIRLAERWAKWERQVGHYRQRPPMIEHFALVGRRRRAARADPGHVPARCRVGDAPWAL